MPTVTPQPTVESCAGKPSDSEARWCAHDSRLKAYVVDGLAPDEALAMLGARLLAIRLVFPDKPSKRCCAGQSPAFIAINPGDPAVSLAREPLAALAPGRAVPGIGLRALAGGLVALPGLELEIAPAVELGPGLEDVVVMTLADAARGLVNAGEADAMEPRTIVIVRGDEPLPAPWQAASASGENVALDAGLDWLVARDVTA